MCLQSDIASAPTQVPPFTWITSAVDSWLRNMISYSFTALLTHMPESFATNKVGLKIQEGRW